MLYFQWCYYISHLSKQPDCSMWISMPLPIGLELTAESIWIYGHDSVRVGSSR